MVVDGEGHAVQRLGAHHAAEAAGMVRVPESLQDLGTRKRQSGGRIPSLLPPKDQDRASRVSLCSANMVKNLLS